MSGAETRYRSRGITRVVGRGALLPGEAVPEGAVDGQEERMPE